MYGWYNGMGWGWTGGIMIIGMVLVVAVAVTVSMVVLRRQHHSADAAVSALRILQERFARDEIDEEEYLRRCAALGH